MHSNGSTMKDGKDQGETGRPAKELRQARLKRALRANLKRRKSQARARADFANAAASDDVASQEHSKESPGK
jgi:hypothetical protein